MLTTCLFILFAVAPAESSRAVTVRTLSGEVQSGTLVALSNEEVTVNVAGKDAPFRLSDLHALTFSNPAPTADEVEAVLLDGSKLNGAAAIADRQQLQWTLPDRSSLAIPLSQVRSLLLKNSEPAIRNRWNELAAEKATVDRLVVRRNSGDGAAAAKTPAFTLDVMEGVVKEVSDTTVLFDLEGDPLKVKREKVEGILFHRPEANLKRPLGTLVDTDGSRWTLQSLVQNEPGLALVTSTGLRLDRPWNRIAQLDFSAGNARYVTPSLVESSSRSDLLAKFDLSLPGMPAVLFDRAPEGPLVCGGRRREHGLWMPVRSSLTLQVPDGFSHLTFLAGFDDRSGATDGARLLIEAEGRTLLARTFERSAEPEEVRVDMAGAKRIRIQVESGGETFLGDTLVLCEAMFTP